MSWFNNNQQQNKLRPSADMQQKQTFYGSSQFLQQSIEEDRGPSIGYLHLVDNRKASDHYAPESIFDYRQRFKISQSYLAGRLHIPTDVLDRIEDGRMTDTKYINQVVQGLKSLWSRPNLHASDVTELSRYI